MKKNLFYRAKDGFTADIIPFFDQGEFKLFYLHDYRNSEKNGEGTPWRLITTENLVDYKELGEVISRGKKDEQDLYIFTGCVFKEKEKQYHIFYTGHNPHLRDCGKVQAVMHAISEDLVHWKKLAEDTFYAPEGFELHDWRDPFVFYDEKSKEFKMLLAARLAKGAKFKRGCTVMCKSTDLKKWEYDRVLWMPNAYFTHECPDLFKMNDTYYLIYSEFSDRCLTRYVMSDSLDGPWAAPKQDSFDGRAYYAAKSVLSDNHKRYLFGWVPTKEEDKDRNHYMWGGNLVCHEIYQKSDKTLGVRLPEQVSNYFMETKENITSVLIEAKDGFIFKTIKEKTNDSFKVEFDLEILDSETFNAGILFNHSLEKDTSYGYILDFAKGRMYFDNVPCDEWRFNNFRYVESILPKEEKYHVELLYQEGVAILYLNHELALSSRIYDLKEESISLFVKHGRGNFTNIKYYEVK